MAKFIIEIDDEVIMDAFKTAAERFDGTVLVDSVDEDLRSFMEQDISTYLECQIGLEEFFFEGMNNDLYFGDFVKSRWDDDEED